MTKPTKIRAKVVDVVDFRMLMRHEMESGLENDKTGETVPAWFIKKFRVYLNNESILLGISARLYLKTRILDATFRES